ncbi:ATP synthase subunit I [Halomonas sp. CnH100-B]|uniref:F0F1 ATP synthase assembly protein I n=1 Tax=Vreelandella aquamarina TaxID=77097 RepID=A0A857GR06_9GAMM|nr:MULTISPECIES: ATP synthase subunit I [Halomonas]HAZ98976.1 F0F1 ATP synthase assembly protein I [Halomonas sp.]MCO7229939.1 ATP synthase subunit I [Halomonas sp. CnH100-B]MDK9688421.1 ATP synthase subunit I [Halomonas sp. LC1]QHD51662.1 F0F1 ATP synthase assembly protein I [Halomonas meridiana]HBM28163.1 F0F1 ATP synthase assembly protein I [Halomonas sp.]
MQRIETQRRRAYVVRLICAQLVVMLFGALLAYFAAQVSGVVSVITGALVALLPHAFFIQRLGIFRNTRRGSVAMDLFRAEAGKFGLTVALFALVFVVVPPSNPAFFFSAYVAVVLTHWLAPWLMPGKSHN